MTAAHTPGPWGLSHVQDGTIRHLVPIDASGTSLLTVVNEGGYDGGEVTPFAAVYSDEDARLIAAAPDMLRALVMAREELACCNVNSAAERIAHAIERATGGAA